MSVRTCSPQPPPESSNAVTAYELPPTTDRGTLLVEGFNVWLTVLVVVAGVVVMAYRVSHLLC